MSQSRSLRASQASVILTAVLVGLICLLVASSIFSGAMLLQKSSDATHAQIDAQLSGNYPSQLAALKQYLADNAAGVDQTAALTAGIGSYNQNSIISTINGYATKAGISITGFSFGTQGQTGGAAAAASSANTVNLSLASPLPYRNFIVFLQLLEHGTMPAQVIGGQVGPNPDASDTVNVTTLSVQVAQ